MRIFTNLRGQKPCVKTTVFMVILLALLTGTQANEPENETNVYFDEEEPEHTEIPVNNGVLSLNDSNYLTAF